MNRETSAKEGTYVLNLRHYAITTKATGVPKRIRRLDAANIPDLGRLEDMADYLRSKEDGGYTSASETELDTDAEVEVVENTTRKVLSRKDMQRREAEGSGKARSKGLRSNVEKRAVKLIELGPRMKLRMVKVEEGVCEGRVMWHEFVTKTKAEQAEMEGKWAQRKKEKEQRKKVQKENVERKRELRRNTRVNAGGTGKEGAEVGDEDDDDEMDDAWDSEDMDGEDAELEA